MVAMHTRILTDATGDCMANLKEHSGPLGEDSEPRPWQSGEEFEHEARLFLEAACRFVGRGEDLSGWSESQRLRLKMAHVIETAEYSDRWLKALQHMLRIAEVGSEHRRHAVQAVHAWGNSYKLPKWQTSSETRRACLNNLVNALEAFDSVFSLLRHDLGNLGSKLDAYNVHPKVISEKSAERILAELIAEGADALGFVVEPREPMQAEILRIQRQLERDASDLALPASPSRPSHVVRKAQPVASKVKRPKALGKESNSISRAAVLTQLSEPSYKRRTIR